MLTSYSTGNGSTFSSIKRERSIFLSIWDLPTKLFPSPGSKCASYQFRKDEKRQYEHFDDAGKGRRVRRERTDGPPNKGGRGGRGGRDRPPRDQKPA